MVIVRVRKVKRRRIKKYRLIGPLPDCKNKSIVNKLIIPAGKTGKSDLFKKNKSINYTGPVKPEKKGGFGKAGKINPEK